MFKPRSVKTKKRELYSQIYEVLFVDVLERLVISAVNIGITPTLKVFTARVQTGSWFQKQWSALGFDENRQTMLSEKVTRGGFSTVIGDH